MAYDYMAGYVLSFRNEIQKMLWEAELCGQISDGQWENASPRDHYQPWGHAKVVVNPEEVGRHFYASKDNYNFTNGDLLDIVGARMLYRVKFLLLYPEIVKRMNPYNVPESATAIRKYAGYASRFDGSSAYWQTKLDELRDAGITQEMLDEVENWDGYTMKDLRKELQDMKKIIKIRL